ncbi:hypothetical protein pdam_00003983 [Pocillopora damicornis]|uniref:ATP-dependent rRNA helicase SPB4-like C-terminal extension domain-containing protein n=1 Tax=Pocillopora damicornis TaxID=46731 RepID=A0A3M6TE31_POCDA|nr:hypothetical protein pdam_00003983 [Pocillopora damicornis]
MHHAMPSGLEIGTVAKSRTLTLLIFARVFNSKLEQMLLDDESQKKRKLEKLIEKNYYLLNASSIAVLHEDRLFFSQLEKLIEKNYYLHKSAREAYKSYLQAYASHQHKSIFNVNALDLRRVAPAFGFVVPPSIYCLIRVKLVLWAKKQGLGTFSLSHPCDKKKIHLPRLHH